MKETSFIDQNKTKWSRFEKLYASKSDDPEELSDLYMDITDDLSYAQTFYKRRTVRVYLNQLAQQVYTGVHKQKGESFRKFFTVWQTSLPLEIYRSRKNLTFALVAFLIYTLIGVITTHFNPDFPRIVMGDAYVEMTLENISRGNPLAVYESQDQLAMFIQITTNNMKVAFFTFFLGFFFTIGTHILTFYNGVMLGAFQYFFYLKGLLFTSFLGIWIHGAFEISAIVLAAGAGITAGNGWLFPRSYTRLQSLQLSTKRGLKIMLSLVPFIIGAGFLESFVTHNYDDLAEWSKWTLIFLSFGLILFVYVFYPIFIARKYPHLVDQEESAPFRTKAPIEFHRIRKAADVIADSFQFYRQYFHKFGRVMINLAVPFVIILVYLQDTHRIEDMRVEHWYDWAGQLTVMIGYDFASLQDILVTCGWMVVLTIIFTGVYWSMRTIEEPFSWKSYFRYAGSRFLPVFVGNLLLYLIVFGLPWYLLMWACFLVPLVFLMGATQGLDDRSFGARFSKGFAYSRKHYGKTLVTLLLIGIFVIILSQPIAFVFSIHDGFGDKPLVTDLLDMLAGLVKRIAREFTDDHIVVGNVVRQIVYLVFFLGIMPLIAIAAGFGYYSENEKAEATGLRNQFRKFGKRDRFQEKPADFD